jgi:hypothetical protein
MRRFTRAGSRIYRLSNSRGSHWFRAADVVNGRLQSFKAGGERKSDRAFLMLHDDYRGGKGTLWPEKH